MTDDRRPTTRPQAATAVSAFLRRVRRTPDAPALRALVAGGAAREEALSWRGWEVRSRALAAALVRQGVRPGDRVAVLAGNRPLWPVADLGILMAGAVSVGIYPTSSPVQVRRILEDSGAVAVLVDRPEQREKVLAARAALPALRLVVCEEAAELPAGCRRWDGLLEEGARLLAERTGVVGEVESRIRSLRPDDDAVLIYTSGSTGEPKGARLSHRCLVASTRSIRETLRLTEADSALSFLPFCHAAERVFGLHTRILCGMEAGLVEDHARLWEAARAFAPTVFGGLPRFFEKVYEALRQREAEARGEERTRWARVLALGRQRSALRRAGSLVPPELEAEWRALGHPLARQARAFLGGRVRQLTSGGAALPAEVAEYLDALGLPILGAYGLTEHLCVAFNRPDGYTFDAAGPLMPGTEVRIAADGEILVRRGELTFSGYHARPADTREAFSDDGAWLRTGDLGELGADGLLRVTGRKKELIALSNGKKVAPLPIEGLLVRDPWIGQAVLIGEGRRFVSAILTLRRPVVEAWARERGLALEYPELLRHPALLERVQAAVDAVNASLSRPESIRGIVLLDRELSAENDELTPTLKVRRSVVAERYRDRLETLYSLPEP